MRRIGILGHSDPTSTVRYFERAAASAGHEFVKMESVDRASSLNGLDCLIVVDPFLTDPAVFRSAPCPVVGYLIDVHQQLMPRLAYARYFDHAFIAQLDFLYAFQALPHPSVHWLPLACDPTLHFTADLKRTYDVGFVGKFGSSESERSRVLTEVLSKFPTNETRRKYTPQEMGRVYSSSKIVFNKSINGDLNMRVFEGMASGSMLITDRISNGLDKIGVDGEHYVTYSSSSEAIEKIRYFVENDREREEIALRGQSHVLLEHTYQKRLSQILGKIDEGGAVRSPARRCSSRTEAVWRSEWMRLRGASPREAFNLLVNGHLSQRVLINGAVGLARGLVRSARQNLSTWSSLT
ncbi:glycosyltransferase [Mesorhizobium sp. M1273]|uniref:CgeB family protein n=1 Tax=unclassified Mesorhizobium TaxID=325217 RepID=UPI00333C4EE0